MKRKFNIVDIVLLALVALAATGALMLRDRSTGADVARETVRIRYTVELTRAAPDMANRMNVGDDVYRSTDNAYLGKVAEVRSIPHAENVYSESAGRFIRYEVPESRDIYLTIEGEGYSTGRDIVVESVTPKIGGEMFVKGKGYAKLGYVVDIDPMGAAVAENTEVGAGEVEATYLLRLDDMRSLLLGCVHVGDRLYEKVTGALMGTVTDVWTEPYGETRLNSVGQAAFAEKEGSYSLYIRLKGRAVEKADGYYLDGGTELKVGANVAPTSQYLDRVGVFYAIESIEKVP